LKERVNEELKEFEKMKNRNIKKYFQPNLIGDEGLEFNNKLQKYIMEFIEKNMTKEFKQKYFELYLAIYGLIILLTRRKSLEFKNEKNRNIFGFDEFIQDEGKMNIIFQRIVQAMNLFKILSGSID
jgi:hypothetical protein